MCLAESSCFGWLVGLVGLLPSSVYVKPRFTHPSRVRHGDGRPPPRPRCRVRGQKRDLRGRTRSEEGPAGSEEGHGQKRDLRGRLPWFRAEAAWGGGGGMRGDMTDVGGIIG